MSKITRREFLLSLAAGAGALAIDQLLVACGQNEPPTPFQEIPTTVTRPTDKPPARQADTPTTAQVEASPEQTTTQSAQSLSPSPSAAPGIPDLVVARGGEPEDLVRRALAALGGMEKFVPKGANVIVKPNICVAYHTYEYAATTNPLVVGALIKLCFEAGAANVRVMDGPFGGTAQEAYSKSGIAEQVKAAGGEMVLMSGFKYQAIKIPDAVALKKTQIFDDILNADVLINVPIAKHHNLAGLTLGMKNLMGVVRDRSALHRQLGENLADLAGYVRPELTVVDAVRILRDHGPTGGNLDDVQKLDTLIASPDIVSADSYAATLFGMQPMDLSYIQAAARIGLGRSDLENLRIEELSVGA